MAENPTEVDLVLASKRETLAALGVDAETVSRVNSIDAADALIAYRKNLGQPVFFRPSNTPGPAGAEDPVPDEAAPGTIDKYLSPVAGLQGARFNSNARRMLIFPPGYRNTGRVF